MGSMGWLCRSCGYLFTEGPRLDSEVHEHVHEIHEADVTRVGEVARLTVWVEPEELAEANLA
jgi:hypothetical protein